MAPVSIAYLAGTCRGAAARWHDSQFADYAAPALKWLATLPPVIVTPGIYLRRTPYRMYVPHNAGDLMTAAWDRGDTDASMAKHRIEKDVWPTRLMRDEQEPATIRFIYTLAQTDTEHGKAPQVIAEAARAITHFGWGIDMVMANASVLGADAVSKLPGERWCPAANGAARLRIPRSETFDALIRRHAAFLNRIGPAGFKPVPPLSEFNIVGYQSASETIPRPFVVFNLQRDDDSRFSYAQEKLIHIAGMVRHMAIESMKKSSPVGVADDWVETYVAGHTKPENLEHRQFSCLPLPSIGHAHTDPAVRRVMITAPVGDDRLLNYLARFLNGQQLKPTDQTNLSDPPTLVQIRADNVTDCYTKAANAWASVTPVILPGHDDHKPERTRKLILKALQQSGVNQPCEFEWSAISHFSKSLSAHKYDRQKRPTGYVRPDHLLNFTAVHICLRFEQPFPGPLAIGAGRHCGLGIFARVES